MLSFPEPLIRSVANEIKLQLVDIDGVALTASNSMFIEGKVNPLCQVNTQNICAPTGASTYTAEDLTFTDNSDGTYSAMWTPPDDIDEVSFEVVGQFAGGYTVNLYEELIGNRGSMPDFVQK